MTSTLTTFPKQPITRVDITSVPTSASSDGHSEPETNPVSLLSSLIAQQSIKEPPTRSLKFSVTSHPSAPAHPPLLPLPATVDTDDESASDLGYEEDSEAGEWSDDDDHFFSPKYPFARPCNYHQHTRERSPSPPPAPTIVPPPPRRGRGHIRVEPQAAADHKSCSRHCSPPPSSAPTSRRTSHSGRLSDAGPREGRAGSPMPDVSDLPTADEEEDEEMLDEDADDDEEDMDVDDEHKRPGRRASEHSRSRPLVPLTQSTNLARARSLGSRVTFKDSALSRSTPIACPIARS